MRKTLWITAFAVAVLCGCAKPDPIVGTWSGKSDMGGIVTTVEQTFDANGGCTMKTEATVPNAGKMRISGTGTYTKKDDQLTVTMKDLKVDEAPKMIEDAVKKGLEGQKSKAETMTIKWVGNDEFTVSFQGKDQSFKRVK